MNSEKFPTLERRATDSMTEKLNTLREHAEHFVAQQVEAMKASGEAMELSSDEERLLRAYRGFVTRSKPGAVFSWESSKAGPQIVTPADVSIIRDPSDVSVTA